MSSKKAGGIRSFFNPLPKGSSALIHVKNPKKKDILEKGHHETQNAPPSNSSMSTHIEESCNVGEGSKNSEKATNSSKDKDRKRQIENDQPDFSHPNEDKDDAEDRKLKKQKFSAWKDRGPPPNKGNKETPKGSPNCLNGYQFVITGVLDSLERDQCADMCKMYGAKVVQSVSKKVTHALVGTEPGESKMQAIQKLKIPILDEDALFKIIRDSLPAQPEKAEKQSSSFAPVVSKKEEKIQTFDIENHMKSLKLPVNPDHRLWVDKYKPKTLGELCANQKIVADLCHWLQQWKGKHLNLPTMKGKKEKRGGPGFEKAVLLSGPPGIGKTTLAHCVCRELNFIPMEFNASDVRNKSAIHDAAGELSGNTAIRDFFGPRENKTKDAFSVSNGQVLIMDEVDGMSSGDRGGMQELINIIKKTKVPIICIANDDGSPKVRSLSNYCLKLRFRRPMASQCRDRILKIANAEGFVGMAPQTAERLAESCRGDFRQIINMLQSWRLQSNEISYTDVVERSKDEGKSFETQSIFELFKKFFEGPKYSISERINTFFMDADFNPMFVQENYMSFSSASKDISIAAAAADSISEGDLISRAIRESGQWSLMPSQAIMSTIRPGSIAQGLMIERPNFPSWFGKHSTTSKNIRSIKEIEMRMKQHISGNVRSVTLDYVPFIHRITGDPLLQHGVDSIPGVIEFLDAYYLSKEDWDTIMDLSLRTKIPDKLPTAVKTAFTRRYNSSEHHISTVSATKITKSTGKDAGSLKNSEEIVENAEENEDVEEDDEEKKEGSDGEDIKNSAFIKKPKEIKKGVKKNSSGAKPRKSKGAK